MISTQKQVAGLQYLAQIDNTGGAAGKFYLATVLSLNAQPIPDVVMGDGSSLERTQLTYWLARQIRLITNEIGVFPTSAAGRALLSVQSLWAPFATPAIQREVISGDSFRYYVDVPADSIAKLVWGMTHSLDGGFALPGGAGAPTGVVQSITGTAPITVTGTSENPVIGYSGGGGGGGAAMPPAWGSEQLWWELTQDATIYFPSSGALSSPAETITSVGWSWPAVAGSTGPQCRKGGQYGFRGAGLSTVSGSSITLSGWVLASNPLGAGSGHEVFNKEYPGGGFVFRIYYDWGGTVVFGVRTSGGYSEWTVGATGFFTQTQPQFWVLTYDGAFARLYVNGILLAEEVKTGDIDYGVGSANWHIGESPSGSTGEVAACYSDYRVANTVRTQPQIVADYKTGTGYP